MEKKLLAISMLVIVGSLSIAGCTINLNTPSSPTATPTPTPSGHNAVLEQTLTSRQAMYANEPKIPGYTANTTVVWNNDNSVTILHAQVNDTTKRTWLDNETLIAFPTTQDATNYVNGLDKSNYTLVDASYNKDKTYVTPVVLGHDPQTYQFWMYQEPTSPNELYEIFQWENVVQLLVLY
jgi:hypothetical protein